MSKEKSSISPKKVFRQEVYNQLENSLPKLKEQLGKDKFGSRLKKAVKILTEGLDAGKNEQPVKGKTTTKPVTAKAVTVGKKTEETPQPEKKPVIAKKKVVKARVITKGK